MKKKFGIITPCFNEGIVIQKFLNELESVLAPTNCDFIITVVDDASSDSTLDILRAFSFKSANLQLNVIRLKYNMGHQEAIRQGLIYKNSIAEMLDGIIVMDSDGEDDPSAIIEIIEMESFNIVFVERKKRSEGFSFKLGYFLYRILFRLTTGRKISFGNYSAVSQSVLKEIAGQKFFHYAGFLSRRKVQSNKLKYNRRKRLDGKSKMNYKSLVFHGLYSIIEYSEEILFSFIKLLLFLLIAFFSIGAFALYSKFISGKAISGWTSTIIINLVVSGLVVSSTIVIGLLLLSIKKTILQINEHYDKLK